MSGSKIITVQRKKKLRRWYLVALALLGLLVLYSSFATDKASFFGDSNPGMHLSARTNLNYPWNFPGQNQQNTWYSPQTMINPYNVANLTPLWRAHISHVYGPPVIVDGVVYVTVGGYAAVGNNGGIFALSETKGQVIWYDNYSNTGLYFTSRGWVAVYNGVAYAGTNSNQLVAINATNGALLWQAPIAQGITGNPVGYYLGPSGTPLVFRDEVIIADTQGDVGARGFLRAFNATDGNLLWTWYSVPPSPITDDNQGQWQNTWGDCTLCGGGDIWGLPALDFDQGLVFVGTGNPSPDFNSTQRAPVPSDTNLYTDCIVALNATTGNLVWYYQENQAESHDWDQGMPVMVFYTTINGTRTEVLAAGGKDGNFFELNAKTGKLYYKVPLGIHFNYNAPPTPHGSIVYPGSFGGINSYSTFDPFTNMVYMIAYNQPSNYTIGPVDSSGDITGSVDNPVPGVASNCTLYAINASTGSIEWSKNMVGLGGGVSSSNDLVFTSDGNGVFYSLNAQTGDILWSYNPDADGYLGFVNRTPPSVTDGILFESLYGTNDGGIMAFTTNTGVYYPISNQSTTNTTAAIIPHQRSSTTISETSSVIDTSTSQASSISSSPARSVIRSPAPPMPIIVEILSVVVIAGSATTFFIRRRRVT